MRVMYCYRFIKFIQLFSQEIMDQRVFYGLLERVGGSGRYQTTSLCIWSLITLVMAISTFFIPFMFYQDDYQCPEGVANCKDYVCSLPSNQRAQFVNQDLYSLASKFGDLRCDNNVEIDRLQSFIYLGCLVGIIAGTFINEFITKRKIIIISVAFNILGLSITVLADTLPKASVGLFINMAACSVQMVLIQCSIVESVSQQVRPYHMVTMGIMNAFGNVLCGIIFYLFKNCLIVILILLFVSVINLLLITLYIEETPFDLIINQSPQDSLAALQRIAAVNGRQQEHKITLHELENIKREYYENQAKNHHESIGILDLFRFDSLRTLTIVGLGLNYFVTFQSVAPEIAIKSYSMSIYTNTIVIGLAQLAGSILCFFIIDHFPRKKVLFISQALCLLSSLPVFLFFACSDGKCSHTTKILQTIGLAIFRFAGMVTYSFFYMQQYQVFPNQIRGIALQFIAMPAYVAPVTVPQIITFCERTGISIVIFFAAGTVIIGALVTCLTETLGIPPQEMIEELKYKHVDGKDPQKTIHQS